MERVKGRKENDREGAGIVSVFFLVRSLLDIFAGGFGFCSLNTDVWFLVCFSASLIHPSPQEKARSFRVMVAAVVSLCHFPSHISPPLFAGCIWLVLFVLASRLSCPVVFLFSSCSLRPSLLPLPEFLTIQK